MADSKSSAATAEPAAAGGTTNTNAAAKSTPPTAAYKAPERNPALRMLGLPNLPKKLPSRNWMIFLSITAAFTGAIIYDKREKKRATARWAKAVAPLAKETISDPSQLPRKLTIIIEAPPGDGLRVAQDHFIEYAKPVLAASGLDWEFIQGRQQGDVRAAVAEKIRRQRRRDERPDEELLPTDENIRDAIREKNKIPRYEGMGGDIIVGRHTWKEYVRGIHEGWLGPLDLPSQPEPEAKPLSDSAAGSEAGAGPGNNEDGQKKEEEAKEEKKEEKPARPPQIPPYNTTDDYSASSLPRIIPNEFSPATPLSFPHLLGFSGTFTRLRRFLNRRELADNIGREVAAVCFATAREWRETTEEGYEQEKALDWEERDWVKSVWKETPEAPEEGKTPEPPKERIWASNMVLDSRIAMRMRRFEIQPEDETRARTIVVPEEEVEGWIKGTCRSLFRWGAKQIKGKPKPPAYTDDEE